MKIVEQENRILSLECADVLDVYERSGGRGRLEITLWETPYPEDRGLTASYAVMIAEDFDGFVNLIDFWRFEQAPTQEQRRADAQDRFEHEVASDKLLIAD